jgi:hypothetical protein
MDLEAPGSLLLTLQIYRMNLRPYQCTCLASKFEDCNETGSLLLLLVVVVIVLMLPGSNA